jgi:hypothetical protein
MAQNKGESTCATMPQVCIIWFSFTSNWTGLYNHIQWFILFPWWNRCTEYTGIRFLWMFWVPSRFTFFQWIHIRVYQAETMLQVCTLLPTIPHLDITSWNRDIYIYIYQGICVFLSHYEFIACSWMFLDSMIIPRMFELSISIRPES